MDCHFLLQGTLPDPGITLASLTSLAPAGRFFTTSSTWATLLAQLVKNPPAMQETWVQSLGREDPLEKGMATHSSILAQRIPWTEEPGVGYSPWGCKESGMTEATNTFAFSKHKTIAIGGCQRLK